MRRQGRVDHPAKTLSFAELDALAGLLARGVRPGQPVSLHSQNRREWIAAYRGALPAGAVVGPANVMLTMAELAFELRVCGAAAVFTSTAGRRAEPRSTGPAGRSRLRPRRGRRARIRRASRGRGRTDRLHRRSDRALHDRLHLGHDWPPEGAVQNHQAVLLSRALTSTMHGRDERDIVVTALPAPLV
ncbi:AMP-binding protein [Amycolatopsis rubida]|uniref:AMP-binding protein n=1 Tax=Amycolatopsis rubida TaxID=112413 RepID=UPI001AD81F34